MSHKLVSLYIGDGEYYTRTDADNVIAELKESVKGLILDNYLKDKELRRHKYKRCLAMARIALDDWHLHNTFYAMGHQEFEKRKCSFYERWHKRWLAIAEKFKETK